MGSKIMKVLLFSGGMESTALAWSISPDRLIFINYGQIPADGERKAANLISAKLKLPLDEVCVDASSLGAGDMVGLNPTKYSQASENWPFRNQLLITIAAMRYANYNIKELIIGTVITDAIHADGTTSFLSRVESLVQCEIPELRVTAPAIKIDTLTLIRKSGVPKNLLGWTFSCHRGVVACGNCRGCQKAIEVFSEI